MAVCAGTLPQGLVRVALQVMPDEVGLGEGPGAVCVGMGWALQREVRWPGEALGMLVIVLRGELAFGIGPPGLSYPL